eukprot:scaffold135270_cov21-Tisochrysis_lutea.AAC.1
MPHKVAKQADLCLQKQSCDATRLSSPCMVCGPNCVMVHIVACCGPLTRYTTCVYAFGESGHEISGCSAVPVITLHNTEEVPFKVSFSSRTSYPPVKLFLAGTASFSTLPVHSITAGKIWYGYGKRPQGSHTYTARLAANLQHLCTTHMARMSPRNSSRPPSADTPSMFGAAMTKRALRRRSTLRTSRRPHTNQRWAAACREGVPDTNRLLMEVIFCWGTPGGLCAYAVLSRLLCAGCTQTRALLA